jgi:hypothetical protein
VSFNDLVGHRLLRRSLGRPAALRLIATAPNTDVVAVDVPLHPWTLGFEQSSPHPITRVSQNQRGNVFRAVPLSRGMLLFPTRFRGEVSR